MKFSSLAALTVVILTIFNAGSDDFFVIVKSEICDAFGVF